MTYIAHPTAVIDEPCRIGEGTKIWHFSHIMAGAEIGRDCILGQNVFVGAGVHIGKGCKIQNNVSIYEGVTLEDFVFCGPSVVFTNVRNPRCEFPVERNFEITYVERGATLGANATVVCGARIGSYAFIAAGAVVIDDVPPYAMAAGAPARWIGWVGRAGRRLNAHPEHADRFMCPRTGEEYILNENNNLELREK